MLNSIIVNSGGSTKVGLHLGLGLSPCLLAIVMNGMTDAIMNNDFCG